MERVGLTVATLGYVSELVSYFLAGQPATVYKLVARIMVKLSKSTKLQKYKCTRLHAYKKHRTAVKRVLHGKWSRGHILTKITLGLTCDDFTLSLGPLEANIYVFSGGLSEND